VGAVNCASCHRKDPREQVRAHRVDILCRACHVINDEEHPDPENAKKRIIEPFAPNANPERFRDPMHVERYFHTNCMMMLKRDCTVQEKGDLITWLLSVEGGTVIPPAPDPSRRGLEDD
jgi:predicted metal-binding protein